MTAIPSTIIDKKGKLTRQEYDLIKQHPVHSMQIIENSIPKSGKTDPELKRLTRIVGEEHERENGTGYPEGKSSDQIDELAKVIGVLDVFEAMSHDRGHRSEYSSFQAIQVIIQMRNEFFSTKVVKAVITEISIFPLESYVILNNGEIGKVVKTNYAHPMRPVIEIVRDSRGKKVKQKKEVDLSSNPLIFITRPIGEEEL
jgi:HD-GYP domain-containing protein (c-di-GMP phosphodiesterase class II)